MPIKTQLPVSLCYADTTIQLLPSRSLKVGHTALVLMPLACYASQYILKLLPCCPCVRIVFLLGLKTIHYIYGPHFVSTLVCQWTLSCFCLLWMLLCTHTSLLYEFNFSLCLYSNVESQDLLVIFFSSAFSAFFPFLKSLSKRFTIAFHGDYFPLSPIVGMGSSISKFFQICTIFLFSFVSFLLAIHTKVSW